MLSQTHPIDLLPTEAPAAPYRAVGDYSTVLNNYTRDYQLAYPYWQVGGVNPASRWVLYISVIRSQIWGLLEKLVPFLTHTNTPFTLPIHAVIHDSLLSGNLGYNNIGKVIGIYPTGDAEAAPIAQRLVELTRGIEGPEIPAAHYIGGAVYTVYEYSTLLPSPTGNPGFLPKAINWPFSTVAKKTIPKPAKFIGGQYLVYQILKSDAKGRVIKAIRYKKPFRLQWCLIKEGKKWMCIDEQNRTIKDRLQWQREVHGKLAGQLPVPAIWDFFEDKGNSYLVMEWIEGKSVNQVLHECNRGEAWPWITGENKIVLIEILEAITRSLQKMHFLGYIHLDLVPGNFISNQQGNTIALTDFELCYSSRENFPDPPFTLGTYGYLSPERAALQTPAITDDLYSIGALLLHAFTGLSPLKFNTRSTEILSRQIAFFTGNRTLSLKIAFCMHPEPACRSSLRQLTETLDFYKTFVKSNTDKETAPFDGITRPTYRKNIIQKAINGLALPVMTTTTGLWLSSPPLQQEVVNASMQRSVNLGWWTGIAGITWLLARMAKAGYEIEDCRNSYDKSWEAIFSFLQQRPRLPAGLFEGAAGMACSLAAGIDSGLLEDNPSHRTIIGECLTLPVASLTVAEGIAGQLMALIHCKAYIPTQNFEGLLRQFSTTLCQNQRRDGTWGLPSADGKTPVAWEDGITGILDGLLFYTEQHPDKTVIKAIEKALDWLSSYCHKQQKRFDWLACHSGRQTGAWNRIGVPGMIRVFLHAYKQWPIPRYKELASSLLTRHPEHLIDDNYSLVEGLAGTGELFIEAAQVLEEPTWLTRAEWIEQILYATMKEEHEQNCYWITDHNPWPAASLGYGNAGIIHFLNRSTNSNEKGDGILY